LAFVIASYNSISKWALVLVADWVEFLPYATKMHP